MTWRQIHSSVAVSASLASISRDAECLYWRLLAQTDSWGRLHGDTSKVKALCCPLLPWTHEEINVFLGELESTRRIETYEANGRRVIQLVDFDEHQKWSVRRRGESLFPANVESHSVRTTPDHSELVRTTPDHSGPIELEVGIKTRVKVKNKDAPNESVPNDNSRERDDVWDFLTEVLGQPVDGERTNRGALARDLRAKLAEDGFVTSAHAAELRARRGALIAEWGVARSTPPSLLKHWKLAGELIANGRAPDHALVDYRILKPGEAP